MIALVMAMIFRREVLAAGDGTPNMQAIALRRAGGRQRLPRPAVPDLSVFAAAAFFLLLLLPVHASDDYRLR